MLRRGHRFNVQRQGIPIEQFALRNRREFADAHITFSTEFGEWQAVERAGLDLERWTSGGYPAWFMAKVVAYHELSVLVEQHSQDAQITLQKHNSSKK